MKKNEKNELEVNRNTLKISNVRKGVTFKPKYLKPGMYESVTLLGAKRPEGT